MSSKDLNSAAYIAALTSTISDLPCSRCHQNQSETTTCQDHGEACRDLYRAEAEAVYHKYIAPLRQALHFRHVINWILAGCIICMLVLLPCTTCQHHVLERAVGIFSEAISFKHLRGELAVAEAKASTGTEAEEPTNDRCSLGILNNNPLNVKGKDWAGQTGSDPLGHAVFSHPYYGLRAGAKTLKEYQEQGVATLEGIVNKWSTSNRDAYVSFLSKRLNMRPDQQFDILAMLPALMEAMVLFESGTNPYPPATYALLGLHADM